MVSHKLEHNDIGKVVGISPDEATRLPLPTSAPAKKKLSLDNVARHIVIDVVNSNTRLAIYHNLV